MVAPSNSEQSLEIKKLKKELFWIKILIYIVSLGLLYVLFVTPLLIGGSSL
jgi:hypothetical protein